LTIGVLNVTEKSQIDCAKALIILKKLSTNLPKGKLLELASKSLIEDESEILKKSLFLRVILMEMQDEINDELLPSVDQIVNLGTKLLAEIETTPGVAETIYYIGIYLFKRSEVSNIGSDTLYDYLSKVVVSNVDQLIKEVTCMTVY
jgi:hypothetical protein